MENTYWNSNGTHQAAIEALRALIPVFGPVAQPSKNRALERFRKASNCYYDLYNNGLGNRARAFATIFGIAPSHYRIERFTFSPAFYVETEEAMDAIVLAAAKEQGIQIARAA